MKLKTLQALSAIMLTLHLVASPALANDPLSIKLDNMKNGITRLIGAVEEQRTQLQNLKSEIQTAGPDDETLEQITSLSGEIEELQISVLEQFREVELNASNMKNQINDLVDENSMMRREQQQLFDRVAVIEDIFRMEKQVDAIVKRSDGSAEIFKLNSLQNFKNDLPSSDDCEEYAVTLENFPDRDLNALFVKDMNGNVQVCKLDYGMSEWQVVPATVADRGHVIKSQ